MTAFFFPSTTQFSTLTSPLAREVTRGIIEVFAVGASHHVLTPASHPSSFILEDHFVHSFPTWGLIRSFPVIRRIPLCRWVPPNLRVLLCDRFVSCSTRQPVVQSGFFLPAGIADRFSQKSGFTTSRTESFFCGFCPSIIGE